MKRNSRKTNHKSASRKIARVRFNPGLFIVPRVESNPRRPKSHGYKSLQIVLGARKPIAVETFVDRGGRLRDLHWDVNAGNVKLARKAS